MNFTDFSLEYTKKKNSKHKSKTGQFFSSQNLINKCFAEIKIPDNSDILEPSFGSGEFLYFLEKNYNVNVDGVELEQELFEHCKNTYKGNFYNKNTPQK